jgi:DNA-binding NtrC family response regulator
MSTIAPAVLVVVHEPETLRTVSDLAGRAGFVVFTVSSTAAAIRASQERQPDMAIVDLALPDEDGLNAAGAIRQHGPHCQIVLVGAPVAEGPESDRPSVDALACLRNPLDVERLAQLLETVRHAFDTRRRAETAAFLAGGECYGMIGTGDTMRQVFDLIRRVAPFIRGTLITGETGTGKELVARALHQAGRRADRPFITINCSALVETLFESELFGHARGAFTGANTAKPGLFEVADGGVIFLDEVDSLPLAVQAKLLRVLELGEIQPVGGLKTRRVDVQVLAATNHALHVEIAAGRFRTDLFYRLNVVEIHLPALRERQEDILRIADAFIADCARRWSLPVKHLSEGALRMLREAPWEGNIRELRNVIERVCMLTDGRIIDEQALAACMPRQSIAMPPPGADVPREPASDPNVARSDGRQPEPAMLSAVERAHILLALTHASGNKKSAAQLLGVSRRALYRRIARLGLESEIKQRSDVQPTSSNGHRGLQAFTATAAEGVSDTTTSEEI